MKQLCIFGLVLMCIFSCKTKNINTVATNNIKKSDTIRIANDSLEYEVTIIDAGYSSWLNSLAYPKNYYSESYLESKNRIYVAEWNSRVLQPMRYDSNLYEIQINYDNNTHYGYEVNYLIYNYMIYFQNTYKQQLNGFVPLR